MIGLNSLDITECFLGILHDEREVIEEAEGDKRLRYYQTEQEREKDIRLLVACAGVDDSIAEINWCRRFVGLDGRGV